MITKIQYETSSTISYNEILTTAESIDLFLNSHHVLRLGKATI